MVSGQGSDASKACKGAPANHEDLEKGQIAEDASEPQGNLNSMPEMGKVNSVISAALLVPNERASGEASEPHSPILPVATEPSSRAESTSALSVLREQSQCSSHHLHETTSNSSNANSSKGSGHAAMEGILPVVSGRRPSHVSQCSNTSSQNHSQLGSTPWTSTVILNPHGSDELSDEDSMRRINSVLETERSRRRTGVHSSAYNNSNTLEECQSPYGTPRRSKSSNFDIEEEQKEDEAKHMGMSISPVKWMITILTAVVVALQCGGMILGSHKLTKVVLKTAALASEEPGNGGPWAGFCVMLGYALLVGFPSAMLVTYVAPNAGGSGIPDLKAHLNGNALPKAFGFGAFFSRSLGLVLVTSAGLFAGTEGPFAHIGGIVGAGLSQGPPGRLRELLHWPAELLGHQAKCEFIAQGAAIGVAAAFGAPVGGVLFTLEEATTFWSKDLTWRSFVGAMVACVCAKLVKNEFKGLGAGGFIDFPDVEASFAIWELIPFTFVGILTGLLGALFCAIAKAIGGLRRKVFHLGNPQKHHKRGRVIEVLVVVTVTLTVIFWVPLIMGCRDLEPAATLSGAAEQSGSSFIGEMPSTICPEGQYSDVAAILLAPKETAIKALFTRRFLYGANFELSGLLAAGFITYVLTLLTFGSAIPAGLFIPNILAGACFGRAVGEHLAIVMPHLDVHPGVYALMGAAGMLAGFSRMTVSLTMILLEITCNMNLIMPLMLCIMIAKVIGDRFTISVYDVILELNPAIHMIEPLDDERAAMLENLKVHDVCTTSVVALTASEPMSNIVRILMVTQYAGYPVVDASNRVIAFIQRTQLSTILSNHHVVPDGPSTPKSLKSPGQNPLINLIEYADTAPETIHWSASVSRGFRMFSATGIQHLCVVDEGHTLLGILTRTDFSALGAHGSHGRMEVQRLINRKQAAAAASPPPVVGGGMDNMLNELMNLRSDKKSISARYSQGTGYSTPTAQTSYGADLSSPRHSETQGSPSSSRVSSRHSTPRGILPGALNGDRTDSGTLSVGSQKNKLSFKVGGVEGEKRELS
eukprot:gnl/MRDRNA2_/MRDRNA2_78268_c0_seq1.p1 gnl/MRDRNA2_/MRDRNA2_78268_c0~~gnl/MRDRNA2_/MRDRNA2_78268_c0_seq1.p1  ORF type:complete len:1042 (+),score=161.10 gnl/MRDRNA2_/MRDRNA2_78268_c0_seq1:132-3257(+)